MAVKPVVYDDSTKKHRPLGSGEKMDGLSASSIISSQSGNLITTGSDGLAYATGSGIIDPAADNLLEATSGGKVKMDVDRLAEWLDGHPNDAKTLSEAIKVVSGDSGNLISKGSDKGAYMSSASLANALAGMSAAQLQQLASALADGKTIVASNGKLTVDPTSATAAQLNKISTAIRKSGGGLSVGSDGKLSVDFASMDPAIMQQVVLDMIDTEGGLAVYSSGVKRGKMYVDFENMPTDKFEKMMKDLKMLVPLSSNMSLYVDVSTGSDELVDGRGTQALPFKTIQACVDYVTQTYSIGVYIATIYVAPGQYSETVRLPYYARTSGYVTIRALDYANPPVLVNATDTSTVVHSSGGVWNLVRLRISAVRRAVNDGLEHFVSAVSATGGATIYLAGVEISHSYTGAASSSGHVYMRTVYLEAASNLVVNAMGTYHTVFEVHMGSANTCTVFTVGQGSQFRAYSTNSAEVLTAIQAFGEFGTFAEVNSQSLFALISGAAYVPSFEVPSGETATGKRYNVSGTAGISLIGSQTLPGDTAGTADSTTYGWYVGG